MKAWYDKWAKKRSLSVGDQVLALLPVHGSSWQARFSGPYTVERKVGDLDCHFYFRQTKEKSSLSYEYAEGVFCYRVPILPRR